MQWHQLVLQLERRCVIAFQAGILELGAKARCHIRGDRDAAVSAMGHEAQCGGIFTGELIEPLPHSRALLGDAPHICRRILYTCDIVELEQPFHRLDRHIDHRACRDIVDKDGNPNGIVNRFKVLIESLLRGLVIIGRDYEHCIRARLLSMPGELDCLCCRIRTSPCNDRNASFCLLNAPFDGLPVFLVRERRALASGPHRHQTVSALRDLPVHKGAKSLLVQRAVAKGGHQRGKRASKARPGGHDAIL